MKRIILAGALALCASAALAQTVADPAAIPLKPWIEFIQPYLTATATVIVPILIAALAQRLSSWLGVSMNATQIARLKSAAATEAGVLIAAADDNLATKSIKVNDPKIVAAANAIVAKLPDTAKAVGATPEAVQAMVAGELGKLQSGTPTVDPLIVNKATG